MRRGGRFDPDLRTFRRFTPVFSVAAAVLDGDFHVMQGVVTNISEVGASLVTNRFVNCGPEVMLKLLEPSGGPFETKARIVWQGQGMAPGREIVGALLGISFLEVSSCTRQKIRDLCLLPDVDFLTSDEGNDGNGASPRQREGRYGSGSPGRRDDGKGGNGAVSQGKRRNGNGHFFDLLIDPNIDQLFGEGPGDRELELAEIREQLQPYLPKSA